MLRAIHMKRFGMFVDRTFTLAGVTVVRGSNQSGKSTLFDAIRIHAFAPSRRGGKGQALYERYGDGADVVLDWDGEPPEMSDAEFMNLFAISSGDAWVDLDGDWLAGVKKSLFAGGIDPRNLIESFEKQASEKGTYTHMRDRSKLETEIAGIETRKEELEAERREILDDLERQEAQRGELKGRDARIGVLTGEESQRSAEVELEERIAEGKTLREQLLLLKDIAVLEQKQSDQHIYAKDRTEELDGLERESRAGETALARAEEAARAEEKRLEILREESARGIGELQDRQAWPRGVQALEDRLAGFEDRKLTQSLLRGVMAALFFFSGIAALVFSGQEEWGWWMLGGGTAAALGMWFLPGLWERRRMIRTLKDLWRYQLGGTVGLQPAQLVLDSVTLMGMRAALAKVTADQERLEREGADKSRDLSAGEESLATLQRALEECRKNSMGAAAALRDWMAGLQVESRDQYRDRRGGYVADRQRLAALGERLAEALLAGKFQDAAQLRNAAGERLGALEREGVPEEGLPEGERRAQKERLDALRGEISQLKQQRHALDRASHGASERLTGRLGSLPEEIAALGESLRRIGGEISAIDFDRQAAARALELFRDIVDDESAVLADLSGSVAGTFARLSGLEPGGEGRKGRKGRKGKEPGSAREVREYREYREYSVALSGLREQDIRAMDRRGVRRPVGHLSSGAQSLLYLALRLEMARKERRGRFALLCFDEPFAFLDPARQLETLQYLRGFLEETGWQMILFTNEPAQAERVQAIFPDCRVHDLGEGDRPGESGGSGG